MEIPDSELIAAVRRGDVDQFGELVTRHSPRLFATARRYARREVDVAELVQQTWVRAYQSLAQWRGDAPFEHWLLRIAVRLCYDQLRQQHRNREHPVTDLDAGEIDWLERHAAAPETLTDSADAARSLVERTLAQLSPSARLVLTLLELEDRPVREIAELTGWSSTLVKVRAFRARAEMRRVLARMGVEKYL